MAAEGYSILIVGPPGNDRETLTRIIANCLAVARQAGVNSAMRAEIFDDEAAAPVQPMSIAC